MLQKFVSMLIEAGFSIIGYPAVFAVNFHGKEGIVEMTLETGAVVRLRTRGAPHQERLESMDLLELFSEMEAMGHKIEPRSGNQYRVDDKNRKLVGEFLIAPHDDTGKMVLQACSASAEYRQVCENAGVPVKDFAPEEIELCLGKVGLPEGNGYYARGCCW